MFAPTRELNERQREAADFPDAPLRVIAGPGTGKTTTLTARAHVLLERGVAPERILLLTFTRRAAREILGRVRASRASDDVRRVAGGTFHSVAHHTLRRHHDALGLPEGFGVLDQADAADLMDLVRGELGIVSRDKRLPKKSTLTALYSRVVNTQTPLAEVMTEMTPWCAERADEVATLFGAFVARKRALGLLDFDDLLLYWREAAEDAVVGATLGAAYDHVLVDEFQDVNLVQLDVLAALRRHDLRVTLVGDDAQAIYGFRGASARHLLDAHERFAGLSTITLELNYRSSAAILATANALAADAPEGFTSYLREAVPVRGARTPQLIHCHDERDQCEQVANRVLEFYEQGVALQRQAVLFRASHHSGELEIELARRRIPFVKYGGLRYLEAAHVKDLLAAFRLTDNPRDEMAWFRLLQLLPGVGPATARAAVDALRDLDGRIPATHDQLAPRAADLVAKLPEDTREVAGTLLESFVRRLHETLSLHAERLRLAIAPLIQGAYEDAGARLEDLSALVAACEQATRLSDVAAEQSLEPPASTGDLAGPPMVDEDWLVLSTVHSAKGLEFDAVHVIHAADGNFPADMALGSPEGLEEERRLFYVAITRARRDLAIYVPLRYHHHRVRDDHSWAQPSRFLSDAVRGTLVDVPVPTAAHDSPPVGAGVINGAAAVTRRLSELW